MGAAQAVMAGRRSAEQLMSDACTIVRPGAGVGTLVEATGVITPPGTTAVYAGKCRVREALRAATSGAAVSVEERKVAVATYLVSIPMASSAEVDDVITITASARDASQVGRQLRVAAVVRGTDVTARRLHCEEITS